MIKNIFLFLSIVLLLTISSCTKKTSDENSNNTENIFDTILYKPKYAKNFCILGSSKNSNTMIKILNPYQGAENVEFEVIIDRDNVFEDISSNEKQILKSEAKNICSMSTSYIAFLEFLESLDKVKAVSGIDYISSQDIQKRKDEIVDIGFENNLNYEALIAKNVDLVLLFAINGENPITKKLSELKIPYAYVGEYLEEDPLGRAEWIIAIGELLGKREKAIDIFKNNIEKEYISIKEEIKSKEYTKKKIMLGLPYQGTWYMASTNSYIAKLITDAGGDYIYTENSSNKSEYIDMEKAYKLLSESDFWLNVGAANKLEDIKTLFPQAINTNVYKTGNIFNNNKAVSTTGANDFWESGVVKPHLILKDINSILYHSSENDMLNYYKKIEN